MDEVLCDSGCGQFAEFPRFYVKTFSPVQVKIFLDDGDGFKGRRVKSFGIFQNGLDGLLEDKPLAEQRPLEDAGKSFGFSARVFVRDNAALPDIFDKRVEIMVQAILRRQAIDQTQAQRFATVYGFSGEDHVQAIGQADQPWQAVRPAKSGKDPEIDFGQADTCFFIERCQAVLARERQLTAAAQGRSINDGNGGYGQVFELVKDVLPGFGFLQALFGPRDPFDLLDVRSGDKNVFLFADDDDGF